MKKRLRFVFLLLSFVAVFKLTAQTFGSEAELKAQAAKLFDDDQFEEAYPLYAQLASLYNKDPNYNYRLGVCMLYTSEDKEKPIPFLEFASKFPDVEKEVFFYLAKAYHLNYRFDDAIKKYQAYQKVASGPKAEKLQVARQIEMCKNGKQLLRNISDLMVIDKKEMSRADFYRSYDITAIGGKLLAKPDEDTFKTPIDKKKKESSIIYFSQDNNQIYFASYGEDASNGKDIYMVRKLPNGELSKPQTLGYPINTEYDEDYPFLHPNGKVLYFCSKGHNSMGGYDIFKTTLNEMTNTWNKPVNLDFPINSPDDDILYVTNADEREAYFSSARSSATGKTAVYHINVDRKPMDVTLIKGTVIKKSMDQKVNVKITVKDMDDNTILGIFNSNPESGDFTLNLPGGGGKVMYTVEAPGFNTQSEIITIPTQNSLSPLKQEISYGDDGKLAIRNLFDQPEDQSADENYLAAISLIKEKSKMEVNVYEMKAAENKRNESGTPTTGNNPSTGNPSTKPATNLSNEEIVKIAYADAKDAEKEAKELKQQADIALVIANQKNEESRLKSNEVNRLTSEAEKIADKTQKQAALDKVNEANKELGNMNQITVTTYNVAKALEMKADEKKKEADLSLQYAKDLEAAVNSKTPKEALTKLDAQQKKLDELSQKNDASATISTSLKFDAENKKKELDKAIKTSADIKQEITDNETAIASAEAEIEKEKNENIKQGLRDQVQGLKDDIVAGKKELAANDAKVAQLEKDYNGINNQIELFNSVLDKAKTESTENTAVTAAAIDKAKLEQQVNELKSADNTLASVKPITGSTTGTPTSTSTENTPPEKTNSATDQPIGTPTTTTDVTTTTTTPTTTDNQPVTNETIAADNKKYEDELVSAETITDPAQRETKKVEVYENWNATIRKNLDSKKQELQTEEDGSKKAALITTIASLEMKLSDTEQDKKEAQATIEKLKTETPVAVNTGNETTTNPTNNTTTNPSTTETPTSPVNPTGTTTNQDVTITADATQQMATFESAYNQGIAEADQAVSTEEKESKKLKAANEYVNSMTLAVNAKKSELQTETDAVKQQELIHDIGVMEKSIAAKQKVADDANTRIALAKNGNTTTTPTETNEPAETTTTATIPPTTTNTGAEPTTSIAKPIVPITTEVSYTNKLSKENLDKAAALDKEAESMLAESKALKEQAILQNDVTEKNAMFTKADDLQRSAEEKKMESSQLQGTANNAQYRNNQHAIDQYVNSAGDGNDQTSVAGLMSDEAKLYFEKAQNSRKAAATFETNYAKQAALDDAIKNEQLALQKQSNVLEIYRKNNPKLVVKPMAVKDVAVTKPGGINTGTETSLNNTNTGTPTNPTVTNETTTTSTDVTKKPEEVVATTNQPNATEKPLSTEQPSNTGQPVSTDQPTKTGQPVVTEPPVVANDQPKIDNNVNNTNNTNNSETPVATNNNTSTPENPVTDNPSTKGNNVSPVTTKTSDATGKKGVSAKLTGVVTTGKIASKELFERRRTSIYSAANPIPIDEKLPAGLIFKVQMGAFKNAIPQNLFKGISPVSGHTTPQGFIRYSAGLFLSCESADKAKNEIRAMGFPDAFVIAFMDGKRIPPPCGTETTTPPVAVVTPKTETTDQPFTKQPSTTTPVVPKTLAATTDVSTINGLFYTVQVGVYSNPVGDEELHYIEPLYTEKANNLVRYNVGIYNSIPLASQAKKIAVGGGLNDAFMTIYYNGKRISMSEAATLTAQGIAPLSDAPGLNQLPTFKTGSTQPINRPAVSTQPTVKNNETPPVTTEPPVIKNNPPAEEKPTVTIPVVPETPAEVEPGIVFKVQIGAFKEEVPLEIANKFLKISKKGIKNYKDENGLTIYTVGKYTTYEEADKSRQEVAAEGLTDAFVVVYSAGKKISVEEAQKLLLNNK
ncbi:MAG TPA: hypothetical protein VFF27_09810 [Bacteroidia bacterium]|nr:hypothetical protein [Bacteroidia bacterium]